MSYTIKPKPTTYKGFRFRSKLEARWAVFFDLAGISWEYEPGVIEVRRQISNVVVKVCPDFYIRYASPGFDCFLEVKHENWGFQRLKELVSTEVAVVSGDPYTSSRRESFSSLSFITDSEEWEDCFDIWITAHGFNSDDVTNWALKARQYDFMGHLPN